MKKLRLKSWVKNILIVIAIISLLSLSKLWQNSAIESCLNHGNTLEYCEIKTR